MTAREIVSVLGKLTPDTQQALSDRAVQRDPRFMFICDLVDEVQARMCTPGAIKPTERLQLPSVGRP